MTHPTIEAMARAIMRTRVADLGVDEATIDALLDDDITGNRPEWRKAKAQALAALRALAACEPSKGMLRAAANVNWSPGEDPSPPDYGGTYTAMLAALVEECERDA